MQPSRTIPPRSALFWAAGTKPAGLPYAATALAIALVTLCQYLYLPTFAGYPFQFYFPVVAIAALLFGTGVFAAVLSGLAALFFFIPPHFSLAITSPGPVLALATFGLGALVIVLVVTLLSRVANHYFRALEKTELEKSQATAVMLDMHRRAANGFHDIAAMLVREAQAAAPSAADPATATLQAAARRFSAMGRIHDRLALPRDSAVMVDARIFFERLCDDLQAAQSGDNPLRFEPMIEACRIPQRQAAAAGHLLSELVDGLHRQAGTARTGTDRAGATITVDFSCEHGSCTLMIMEDRPLPTGSVAARPNRPVVATLLSQLQGSLDVEDTRSPTYLIRFPQDRAAMPMPAAA